MSKLFDAHRWLRLLGDFDQFLGGMKTTFVVSLAGLILALALGILFGLLHTTKMKPLQLITRIYVEFFQNTPLVVQVFFYSFGLPMIGIRIPELMVGILGVGLYHGAYIAEVIRSGIEAIPKGQVEAAESQGFRYLQIMRYIILPQTMKIILPPLTNQAMNLIKNTSVLAMIAGMDIMYFAKSWAGNSGFFYQGYLSAGLLYFIICFPLAKLTAYLELRAKQLPASKKSGKMEADV